MNRQTRCIRAVMPLVVVLLMLVDARAQRLNLPTPTRLVLANGMRVVLVPYKKLPTLNVVASVAGGASADPAGKAGVANLTAELLRAGTTKRSATEIAEAIDFLGGDLETSASADRLVVSLEVLAKDADSGLDLMADIMRNPTFPDSEIARLRALEVAQLQSLPDNPRGLAGVVSTQTVYAGHPYGNVATISGLKTITRDDILTYYRRIMVPNRTVLVVVGDLSVDTMRAKISARFGDWAKSSESIAKVAALTAEPTRRCILVDKPDATQSVVQWVRPAFPVGSPDYFAAEVASAVVGGGFSSRLVNEVRVNKSLTYNISSDFSQLRGAGSFGVRTFTKVQTTRDLVKSVHGVLAEVATRGLTTREIEAAKGFLAGSYALDLQTPESLATQMATAEFYGLPADYLTSYIEKIRAVTPASVRQVTNRYFAPDALSLIVVGPASKITSQLQGLGTIEKRAASKVVQ